MNKNRLVIFFSILLALNSLPSQAKESNLSGAFPNVISGARPLVFGSAFAGIYDDIDVLYSNPAAVSELYQLGVIASHTNLFNCEGLYYDSIGVLYSSLPAFLPKGLVFKRLGTKSIIKTDEKGSIIDLDSTYAENTCEFIFPYKLPHNFSLGITPKFLILQADKGASGFGLDAGLLNTSILEVGRYKLSGGVLLNNIYSSLGFEEGGKENLPKEIKTAIGLNSRRLNLYAGMSPAIGVLNLAGELNLSDFFSLRGGYENNDGESILRAGVGVKLLGTGINYAYENHPTLGDTHRVSISYTSDLRGDIYIPEVPLGSKIIVNNETYIESAEKKNITIKVLPGEYSVEVHDKEGVLKQMGPPQDKYHVYSKETVTVSVAPAYETYKEGMKLFEACEYEKALAKFKYTIKAAPQFADVWYQSGRTYEFLLMKTEAIEAYKKSLELKPKEYEFLNQVIKDIEGQD
ncbi:MAG: hypothetical protein QME81_01140 [bacterium]|nr:hypothetical protein [bacterium]